ncbi:MAG: tRNA (adenosine(37)-N6)-dimethylallyltransferase MiaA [Desulfovibrionaceae bacterium]|nr:tRNA (adenosine(37)-N6)-dimethylallyltransferase MiaA [Desulfovibrionaceae bacterium]
MSEKTRPPIPKILCLAGPTGSGKSRIAARLGELLGGTVINADSRQVYADFPIITAQPGETERGLCPHLLYGFLDCREKISAGHYFRLARPRLEEELAAGRLPILTGGTGLYFRALLSGLADIPQVDAEIRRKWQERCAILGSPELHRELSALDPEYAGKIHPHDRQRITRALEVREATGRPLSWWLRNRTKSPGLACLYLGLELNLAELEPLLRGRIETMLDNGGLEEARQALERCPDPSAPGWSGIGCAELYRFLTGELVLDEAKELWIKNTRAYAKRQLTWFRAEKAIIRRRPEDFGDLEWVRERLGGGNDQATP